jgi:hypothetical protein
VSLFLSKYFYVHIVNYRSKREKATNKMEKNLKTRKRVFASLIVIALLASLMAATLSVSALQPVTLTLVGPTGTTAKNRDDILSMPSTTGFGGTKGSGGNVNNKGTYVGVSVLYLCNLVGGINNGDIVKVIDQSGSFIVSFSYQQVHDGVDFNTYNADTGANQTATLPLTLIIAYSYNGSDITGSNGPLRAAALSPEGLVTDGSLWNKQVARIEITTPVVPEYPIAISFVLIACVLTLIAYFASKKTKTYRA